MVKGINNIQNSTLTSPAQKRANQNAESFEKKLESFEKKLEGIILSKHARKRLLQRGVPFDQQIAESLSKGIDQAEQKGSQDALLMLEDSAYIVGVSKRQLVTAFKVDDMGKIVTNIDTAVILSADEK